VFRFHIPLTSVFLVCFLFDGSLRGWVGPPPQTYSRTSSWNLPNFSLFVPFNSLCLSLTVREAFRSPVLSLSAVWSFRKGSWNPFFLSRLLSFHFFFPHWFHTFFPPMSVLPLCINLGHPASLGRFFFFIRLVSSGTPSPAPHFRGFPDLESPFSLLFRFLFDYFFERPLFLLTGFSPRSPQLAPLCLLVGFYRRPFSFLLGLMA